MDEKAIPDQWDPKYYNEEIFTILTKVPFLTLLGMSLIEIGAYVIMEQEEEGLGADFLKEFE